jgi:hypothetical protein
MDQFHDPMVTVEEEVHITSKGQPMRVLGDRNSTRTTVEKLPPIPKLSCFTKAIDSVRRNVSSGFSSLVIEYYIFAQFNAEVLFSIF